MYNQLNKRVKTLQKLQLEANLLGTKTGLEKESLRVTPEGFISQLKHPEILGSALTHPSITTDYSEALMELITPPLATAKEALDYLLDIESFVYQNIGDELLWTTSMPCIIHGEDDIQIADYGSSNAGKMKSVYRHGLAWRYGKMMQVIAGIHFNHSFSESFWINYQKIQSNQSSLQDFIDTSYMGLTRNLLRYGWLIPYLFGSSPAICKSFLNGQPMSKNMQMLNNNTVYEPYGTSLRMGDIGYTNLKEEKAGIKANYNCLHSYINSLRCATSTICPEYEKIGIKVDGQYRQLNAAILQIENEYYSTVRPKQILKGMEKPVDALGQRGIQYIELRSLDIDVYHPAGMTSKQLYFLKTFMLFCLLQDSPDIESKEQAAINNNQSTVAHLGRKPGLTLDRNGKSVSLKAWANELLDAMQPVAALLSGTTQEEDYLDSLQQQIELVKHPDTTPSARIIDEIVGNNESYYEFAKRKSNEHREIFLKRQLSATKEQEFRQLAKKSIKKQQEIESSDTINFDTFLKDYFNQ
ncbi:MAG TPA: glutamate--cysteine ligase [Thiotrichaceae bacterium]|nr:glutamate--cysteine ligase [Thiotrichaceae bacterium]